MSEMIDGAENRQDQAALIHGLMEDATTHDFYEQKWREWSEADSKVCDVITRRVHELTRLDPNLRLDVFKLLIFAREATARGIYASYEIEELNTMFATDFDSGEEATAA